MNEMNECHPAERMLARSVDTDDDNDDDGISESLADHLARCPDCRRLSADYRWLERELTATLSTVAREAPIPRPAWWEVQTRAAARQKWAAGRRWSAGISLVLSVCLMLIFSPMWSWSATMLASSAPLTQAPVIGPVTPPPRLSPTTSTTALGSPTVVASNAHLTAQPFTPTPTPALILPPTPNAADTLCH
jgi:anti-sigma factor RsiW